MLRILVMDSMPKRRSRPLTKEMAIQCRELVEDKAREYGIPASHITAHVASVPASQARFEVWRVMINEWGMKRHVIARMFSRDLRRLRASVIDNARPPIPHVVRQVTPVVLVGDQMFWDLRRWHVPLPCEREGTKKRGMRLSCLVAEIPNEVVGRLDAKERKFLKRQLRMQLAKL